MSLSEYADTYSQALYYHHQEYPDSIVEKDQLVVLRAMDCKYFKELLSSSNALFAVQTYKPYARAVSRYDVQMTLPERQSCSYALVMATRDKQETVSMIAQAVDCLTDDGLLMVVASNDLGAGPIMKRLKKLGPCEVSFKARCKVAHIRKSDIDNNDLLNEWEALCIPQIHKEGNLLSVPGIFSWKSPDKGSQLLASTLKGRLKGAGADPGCGNGYLSFNAIQGNPDITSIALYDIEHKALECAAENLQSCATPISLHWHNVLKEPLEGSYDWIIMNPPFHRDTITDPETGKRFIVRAAEALKNTGELFMVANNNLPYLPVLREYFSTIETLEKKSGFRVVHAQK